MNKLVLLALAATLPLAACCGGPETNEVEPTAEATESNEAPDIRMPSNEGVKSSI